MIYYKYINDKAVIKTFVQNNENENEENKSFDAQIEHSFRVEEMIYDRLIMKFSFSTKTK